jgi:hypothetical protein
METANEEVHAEGKGARMGECTGQRGRRRIQKPAERLERAAKDKIPKVCAALEG